MSRSEDRRIVVQKNKPYPTWVCSDCGKKASKKGQFMCSTWHKGKCGVCGEIKAVTEPRDFHYPKFRGHKNER